MSKLPALSLLSIATLAIPLSACNKAISDHLQCPPLVTYSREFQTQAAKELDRAPGSAIAVLVTDYSKLRDACRGLK